NRGGPRSNRLQGLLASAAVCEVRDRQYPWVRTFRGMRRAVANSALGRLCLPRRSCSGLAIGRLDENLRLRSIRARIGLASRIGRIAASRELQAHDLAGSRFHDEVAPPGVRARSGCNGRLDTNDLRDWPEANIARLENNECAALR